MFLLKSRSSDLTSSLVWNTFILLHSSTTMRAWTHKGRSFFTRTNHKPSIEGDTMWRQIDYTST
jgi:hypothetical protein